MPDDETWTIRELEAAVADALAHGYRGAPSGQVRAIPDERTIRYYTTLGLIDRPLAMRGRTALYGRRHLIQIVAIKRMQEAGKTLAEIQESLAAKSDAALARVADLGSASSTARAPRPAPALTPAPERARFWRDVPALVVADSAPASSDQSPPRVLAAIELIAGVSLIVDAARPLDDDDRAALGRAAVALLEELHIRQIITAPRRA